MGRVTTRAIEYLKEDFTFNEDVERVVNFELVLVFEFDEIGSDVKEKEREKESFTWLLIGFVEKHVKKNKGKRNMQSGTEENRAIEKQRILFRLIVDFMFGRV